MFARVDWFGVLQFVAAGLLLRLFTRVLLAVDSLKVYTHTHRDLHTPAHTRTHTYTHIHTHTYTHTHTHTHTHTRADTCQDYGTSLSLLFIVPGSATRTFLAILPSSVFAKVMLWLSLDLVYGCFMEVLLKEFLLQEL